MSPFGDGDDWTSRARSGSYLKEEMSYKDRAAGVRPHDLKLLLHRMKSEENPVELVHSVTMLFEKAFRLENEVIKAKESMVAKAIGRTIRLALYRFLDQIESVFDSEGDEKSVVSALIFFAVSRNIRIIEVLERASAKMSHEKLECCLRDLADGDDFDDRLIRVSTLVESTLAFEFMAGWSTYESLEQSEMLPLQVNITSFLFAEEKEVLETRGSIHKFKTCDVKIKLCSHRRLLASTGSGVVGEALVKVNLMPISDIGTGTKDGSACWSRGKDVSKLRLLEVRA